MMPGARSPGDLTLSHYVTVHPPETVTTVNRTAESAPMEAGLDQPTIDAIWKQTVSLYETGLHPAIAICLRRRGKVVLDRAIGHLRACEPEENGSVTQALATPDTLFNLFSASKAITAMVIHQLDERHLVHLDDPVAEVIPEFGRRGKEWITLRHILTHRAGIPTIPGTEVDLDLLADSDRIVGILCDAEPVSPAGRRLAYHALTGGYVLGEVVKRVTGKDIQTYLKDEITEPIGFENFRFGVADDRIDEVAVHASTGPRMMPPVSTLLKRALGVGVQEAIDLSNDPRFLTAVIPSGNLITTANEGCLFYEMLLRSGELNGVRVFDRRTVRRAVAEHGHLEFDFTLCLPVRYGMGFMLGHSFFSPYGAETHRAFGHLGFTNVIAWADPERDLSCCIMTSGKPFITLRALKWIGLMRLISRVCPRT
jgi:CubicO group peptidase (beta-lactamase class C family)